MEYPGKTRIFQVVIPAFVNQPHRIPPEIHTNTMNKTIQRKIEQFTYNFCKCGIAGWCLEVLFTSMESVMIHDWRLMAKTSLLMFPIYGMGAVLPEISRLVDGGWAVRGLTGWTG